MSEQSFYDYLVSSRDLLGSVLDDRSQQRLTANEIRIRLYDAIEDVLGALQMTEN